MPRYGEIKYGGGWKYGIVMVARFVIKCIRFLDTLLFHRKANSIAHTTIPNNIKFKELHND